MSTTRTILSRAFILTILVFISCSKAKQDYEELRRIQDEADKAIVRTTNYDIKIKSCESIIVSLQAFLKKYPEGEWSNIAKTALMSWQSKKDDLLRERSHLSNQLYSRLKERAIEEARKVHRMSKIEDVSLLNRDETTHGVEIHIRDAYSIRMRGALLGVHIFKMNVIVSGYASTESKKVFIDEKVVVQE